MVELRGDLPRDLVDVIDAVAISEGSSRIDVVADVLAAWAAREVHRASLISRIAGRNPPPPDSTGLHHPPPSTRRR
jgi:hypothetical protein